MWQTLSNMVKAMSWGSIWKTEINFDWRTANFQEMEIELGFKE